MPAGQRALASLATRGGGDTGVDMQPTYSDYRNSEDEDSPAQLAQLQIESHDRTLNDVWTDVNELYKSRLAPVTKKVYGVYARAIQRSAEQLCLDLGDLATFPKNAADILLWFLATEKARRSKLQQIVKVPSSMYTKLMETSSADPAVQNLLLNTQIFKRAKDAAMRAVGQNSNTEGAPTIDWSISSWDKEFRSRVSNAYTPEQLKNIVNCLFHLGKFTTRAQFLLMHWTAMRGDELRGMKLSHCQMLWLVKVLGPSEVWVLSWLELSGKGKEADHCRLRHITKHMDPELDPVGAIGEDFAMKYGTGLAEFPIPTKRDKKRMRSAFLFPGCNAKEQTYTAHATLDGGDVDSDKNTHINRLSWVVHAK